MMNKLTSMSGTRMPKESGKPMSKGKMPKGKMKHIHVEPMDGGFTVESRHETPAPKGGKKGMGMAMPMDYDSGMHRAGFGNSADAMKHIGSLMGAGAPAPEGDDAGAPPAGGPPAGGEPDGDEGE